MAAAAGWAIVSAGSWMCTSLGAVGATAAGVTIGVPVLATATSAAVAYKYGVTPALVLSGTSTVLTTTVSTTAAAVVQTGKMTLKGIRYITSLGSDDYDDDDD